MDKYCEHQKIVESSENEYYFFTWSLPKVSFLSDLSVSTADFKMLNGYTYKAILSGSTDKITFSIVTTSSNLKCFVSMVVGSETVLFSNSLDEQSRTNSYTPYTYYYYDLITLSSEHEIFQKLKKHPNDTVVFICRIIYISFTPFTSSVNAFEPASSKDSLYNLKTLAAILKNSSESLLKEKVTLRVGEESDIVSKAVLCARSPVFAKMFQNDMKELKENTVTVTDIKMPVLRTLVSFLYTGKLLNCDSDLASNFDFDFVCELYYAADKYDITELRQLCVQLIIHRISKENIIRVMKLAFSHNDVLLKSSALGFAATNIDAWINTNDLRNLINDEPQIASEILNFFYF